MHNQQIQHNEDQNFITAGLIDINKALPPVSKAEYAYYMQLPDKKDLYKLTTSPHLIMANKP